MKRETHDTVSMYLESTSGGGEGEPGQFNMLYAFGVGEVPISLSGVSERDGVRHTLRGVGSVTEKLCATRRGGVIGVRGPFGTGWPLDSAVSHDVIMIAGGIGLAPLRPAIEAVTANRGRYKRVAVVCGARTPDDLLFESDLRRWRSRFDLDVQVTVDSADEGWRGNVGLVTALVPRAGVDFRNAAAFICGPQLMMRLTAEQLLELGAAPERVHISMERNMKCAVGFCGHCQLGPEFVCKDGPVFRYDRIAPFLAIREI